MASTFGPRLWRRSTASVPPARSLGRRMTVHAAAALIAFAALQVWLVASAVSAGAPSALIIVALIMLVALALPIARMTERRWQSATPARGLFPTVRRFCRVRCS